MRVVHVAAHIPSGCVGGVLRVHGTCTLQKSIHGRAPIFLGCKRDVEEIQRLYAEMDAAADGESGASTCPPPSFSFSRLRTR